MKSLPIDLPIQAFDLCYFYERPGLPQVPMSSFSTYMHRLGLKRKRPNAAFRNRAALYAPAIHEVVKLFSQEAGASLLKGLLKDGLGDMWSYLHGCVEGLQHSSINKDDPGLTSAGIVLGLWRLMHYDNVGHYLDGHRSVLGHNPTPFLQILPFIQSRDLNDSRVVRALTGKTLLAVSRTPYWDHLCNLVRQHGNRELISNMETVMFATDLYRVRTNVAHVQSMYLRSPEKYIAATRILKEYTHDWMYSVIFLRSRLREHGDINILQLQHRSNIAHYAYDWTDARNRHIGTLAEKNRSSASGQRIEYSNLSYLESSGHLFTHIFDLAKDLPDRWFVTDSIDYWGEPFFAYTCRLLSSLYHKPERPSTEYPTFAGLVQQWPSANMRDACGVLAQSQDAMDIALRHRNAFLGVLQFWTMQCRNALSVEKLFDVSSLTNTILVFSQWSLPQRATATVSDVFIAGMTWMVQEHFRHNNLDAHAVAAWIYSLQRIWIEMDVLHDMTSVTAQDIETLFAELPHYIANAMIPSVGDDDLRAVWDLDSPHYCVGMSV